MEHLFQKLGFSPTETSVYLALAELGKAAASLLAKKANIPRSTTYSVLESLIQKGVVSIEHDKDVTLYLANSPTSLTKMVDSEKENNAKIIKDKEDVAQELLKLVSPMFTSSNFSIPRIQFFEGTKNIENMLYTYEAEWQESISRYDFTWWGYQDTDFVLNYRQWLDRYWSKMKPEEKVNLLSNRSEIENKLRGKISRRQIKKLPKGTEFSSTIWSLGEYVIMIMTRQQPHYAFQLKDAVFAANQRTTFQLLWKLI